MILVDRQTMQKIDSYAINELKIPSLCLVERASLAILKNINLNIRQSFAVVASCGNNGADGLALARNLLAIGKNVDVYIIGNLNKASCDFLTNLKAIKKLSKNIYEIQTIEDLEFMRKNLAKVNTIIDAIFGTGLNRTVSGLYAMVISIINQNMTYTISVDIPSGLDSNGEMDFGEYVDSDLVISMQLMKKGLFENSYFKGKVVVEDIGIPKKAIEKYLK